MSDVSAVFKNIKDYYNEILIKRVDGIYISETGCAIITLSTPELLKQHIITALELGFICTFNNDDVIKVILEHYYFIFCNPLFPPIEGTMELED